MKKTAITILSVLICAFLLFSFQRIANSDIETNTDNLAPPIDNFDSRPKLLTFGVFVTPDPENNPIDPPERFSGYHTALDLEVTEDELSKDVNIYSVCSGRLIYAQSANGYGGVMIQKCKIQNINVTVLYGHLDPISFAFKVGDEILSGKKIAILGDNKTEETGDTRKHLHLSIHKGYEIELLGYVESEEDLEDYIDPLPLFQQ